MKPGAKGKGQKVTKKVCTTVLLLLPPSVRSSFTCLGLMALDQFTINAAQPASDKIFDVAAFEKFLHDRIKVDGRVGNLGDAVQISQQGQGKIEIVTHIDFSGRYLKYL